MFMYTYVYIYVCVYKNIYEQFAKSYETHKDFD